MEQHAGGGGGHGAEGGVGRGRRAPRRRRRHGGGLDAHVVAEGRPSRRGHDRSFEPGRSGSHGGSRPTEEKAEEEEEPPKGGAGRPKKSGPASGPGVGVASFGRLSRNFGGVIIKFRVSSGWRPSEEVVPTEMVPAGAGRPHKPRRTVGARCRFKSTPKHRLD